MALEREEKERDEPSPLSSLWEDSGITESETVSRVHPKCAMLEAQKNMGWTGPFGRPRPTPDRRSPTERAHPLTISVAERSS